LRYLSTYPAVFENYAKRYETGAPMPAELAAKLSQSKTFNQGFALTEVLAAAELDMQWHTQSAGVQIESPDAFEKEALQPRIFRSTMCRRATVPVTSLIFLRVDTPRVITLIYGRRCSIRMGISGSSTTEV
jgi:Zn-dependent oligopeptidase